MEALGVFPGPLLPGGDGTFIEGIGGDDGLQRAAVGQQGENHADQVERLMESEERGVAGGREGLAAASAAEASFLVGVDFDVALIRNPSFPTVEIGTELGGGVHWRSLRELFSPLRLHNGPLFLFFHGTLGCYQVTRPRAFHTSISSGLSL